MTFPKDLPRELRGLWRVQYEPREKVFLKNLNPSAKSKYKKLNYIKKIKLIDRLQADGFFDN